MTEQFRPDIAVLLNFSPDHLDRHATVEEYAEAKQRIFANQREQDWAVINVDDPEAVRLASVTRAKTVSISQGAATRGRRCAKACVIVGRHHRAPRRAMVRNGRCCRCRRCTCWGVIC